MTTTSFLVHFPGNHFVDPVKRQPNGFKKNSNNGAKNKSSYINRPSSYLFLTLMIFENISKYI